MGQERNHDNANSNYKSNDNNNRDNDKDDNNNDKNMPTKYRIISLNFGTSFFPLL